MSKTLQTKSLSALLQEVKDTNSDQLRDNLRQKSLDDRPITFKLSSL
jgi:hypothetical protein